MQNKTLKFSQNIYFMCNRGWNI